MLMHYTALSLVQLLKKISKVLNIQQFPLLHCGQWDAGFCCMSCDTSNSNATLLQSL